MQEKYSMTGNYKTILIAAVMVAVIAIAGCGDDDPVEEPLECGANTVLEGDRCVPQERCEEGEIVTPRGFCEPEDIFCGEGSVYDSENKECVTDADIHCGPGTVEEEGRCVVENPLHCGEGTVLADESCELADEVCGDGAELEAPYCHPSEEACADGAQWDVASGECVDLEEVSCGESTVEDGDVCVPMGSWADELAADADIDYADGEAIVPSEEETFVFTGQLETSLSQTFEVEAEEGQWLEVTVYPRGLPSPGFELQDSEGAWHREKVAGMESVPSRTVLTPVDDVLELSVTTRQPENGMEGDDNWQYVGTVDVVEAPAPYEWDFESEMLEGDLKLAEYNFVEMDVEQLDGLVVEAQYLGEDAEEPTVEVWASPQEFSERHELEVGENVEVDVSELSTMYLHVDAAAFYGSRTDFELQAMGRETLEDGEIFSQEIWAQEGEVIFLSHENDQAEALGARVYLDEELKYELDEVLAANQSSYAVADTKREFFFAAEEGEYVVEFQNHSTSEVTGFLSRSYADLKPTFEFSGPEVEDFDATLDGDGAAQGDWKIAVVRTAMPAVVDVAIDIDSGTSPNAQVFNEEREEIAREFNTSDTTEIEFVAQKPGAYFVAMKPGSTAISGDIEIAMEARGIEIVEPGEVIEETFDVDTFDLLRGSVGYADGEPVDVRLINPYGELIFEKEDLDLSDHDSLTLLELFPGPGEFTLEIENKGESSLIDFALEAEVTTPLDSVTVHDDDEYFFERGPMQAGDREFVVVQSADDLALDAHVFMGIDQVGVLRIWDVSTSSLVAQNEDMLNVEIQAAAQQGAIYVVEFEAVTDLDDGYELTLQLDEIQEFEVSVTSEPGLEVWEGDTAGVDDTINIDSCPTVQSINLDMEMIYTYTTELVFTLTSPGGEEHILWARGSNMSGTGGVVGNFNETIEPDTGFSWNGDDAEPIEVFEGVSGTGGWTMNVSNHFFTTMPSMYGDFESWTLNLTCGV